MSSAAATVSSSYNSAATTSSSAHRSLVVDECHCDEDDGPAHCDTADYEDFFVCEGGDIVAIDGCHCDGSSIHCNSGESEAFFSCNEDGDIQFLGPDAGDTDESKPWGEVILATFLVNLVTLIGVIFFAGELLRRIFCPNIQTGSALQQSMIKNFVPSFACGALLATVVFLVLPEALHLIADGLIPESDGDDHSGHNHRRHLEEGEEEYSESMATWRFGVSVMGGFLIPVVMHSFFPHKDEEIVEVYKTADNLEGNVFSSVKSQGQQAKELDSDRNESDHPTEFMEASKHSMSLKNIASASGKTDEEMELKNVSEEEVTSNETGEDTAALQEVAEEDKVIDWSLFASLSVGDFAHNFCDGIFIGTAFLLCDRSLAITITVATILHELPQEIADYFLLVHECNMTPLFALTMNFLVGFSIMLGGIIVLAIPDISNTAIGVILAIGGGVYLHVAIVECYLRAEKHQTNTREKLRGFLGFLVGAVPIGLVLLNHEHCGGHNH